MEQEELIQSPNDQAVNWNDEEEEFDMSFTHYEIRER